MLWITQTFSNWFVFSVRCLCILFCTLIIYIFVWIYQNILSKLLLFIIQNVWNNVYIIIIYMPCTGWSVVEFIKMILAQSSRQSIYNHFIFHPKTTTLIHLLNDIFLFSLHVRYMQFSTLHIDWFQLLVWLISLVYVRIMQIDDEFFCAFLVLITHSFFCSLLFFFFFSSD